MYSGRLGVGQFWLASLHCRGHQSPDIGQEILPFAGTEHENGATISRIGAAPREPKFLETVQRTGDCGLRNVQARSEITHGVLGIFQITDQENAKLASGKVGAITTNGSNDCVSEDAEQFVGIRSVWHLRVSFSVLSRGWSEGDRISLRTCRIFMSFCARKATKIHRYSIVIPKKPHDFVDNSATYPGMSYSKTKKHYLNVQLDTIYAPQEALRQQKGV